MNLSVNNNCISDCMKILSNNNIKIIKDEIESLKFDFISLYPVFMSIQCTKDFNNFFKLLDKKIDKFTDIMLKIKSTDNTNQKEFISCIDNCDKEEITRHKQSLKTAIILQHILTNKKIQKLMKFLYKRISDKKVIKRNLEIFDKI